MSHGDQVAAVSDDFRPLAETATCPIAAVKHRSLPIYGLQFHPEVTHTPQGEADPAQLPVRRLRLHRHLEAGRLRRANDRGDPPPRSATDRVICGLSGGVDSSVTAALLAEAVGHAGRPASSSTTGCCRKGEAEVGDRRVHATTSRPTCTSSSAEDRFLAALAGITDPQEKRRRIGHVFIECFADEASRDRQGAKFLAQGTLYPDVIESGGAADGPAATIKLHHNVGGLPEDLASS